MTSRATANQATWVHAAERSNMLMLRVMTWISLRLGRNTGRIVLHLIASYFLLLAPASRRASRDYLRRALGRPARWQEIYHHFFIFAATIHDRIYLGNCRFDLFDFEVHGGDRLRNLIARGKGVFLIGAHLGSFEVIRALGWKNNDIRVAMVMHEDNAKKINAMLGAINPKAAQDIIGLGHIDSMLQVRQRLDEGCAVGMLADRTPGNDTLCPVQILGAEAHLPIGPFRMAALLRRPVIFMTGLYLGGNRYEIHFDELADFSSITPGQQNLAVHAALVRYAELLDYYCRMAPFNWFNFFDFWQPVAKIRPTPP